MIRFGEKLPHFVVGCLREVFIPLTDSLKVFRHNHRDDLIGGMVNVIEGGSWNHRGGDNNLAGLQLPQGRDCDNHR